jgi:hypothetical protein
MQAHAQADGNACRSQRLFLLIAGPTAPLVADANVPRPNMKKRTLP